MYQPRLRSLVSALYRDLFVVFFLDVTQYKYRYSYIYISTQLYKYIYVHPTPMNISKRLGRLDLEIHKID
jgi:hypothetical protein